jgi:hypothetical protein
LDDADLHLARLPASCEKQSDDRPGEQELSLGRHSDAVPAATPVEDLLPAHTEPRHEVLEIGHRRCRAAEHGGIEGTAPRGEQCERGETAADLEAPVGNVLVRYAVTG